MKKILLSAFLLASVTAFAQDTMNDDNDQRDREEIPYNQWSLDFGIGAHHPHNLTAPGFFVNNPSFFSGDLGVRYMINDKFGINLDLGLNYFENADKEEDQSGEFQTNAYRAGLEGVVNVGTILGFREWTDTFNVLGHGGIGMTAIRFDEDINDETDWTGHFIVGITPQIKLSDNFALNLDASIVGYLSTDASLDGTREQARTDFDGFVSNYTIGLNWYLGNKEVHADWYNGSESARISELEERVATLETNNADDDQDGVPNYLDRDNTTESGVRVDNKGRALDVNKNGIPDDMESALDSRYAKKGAIASGANGVDGDGLIKQLINDGYVNVYFEFNSTKPTQYSLSSINFLATYLRDNPEVSATLTGYADEIGSEDYNKNLSERRAKMVNDILVATGVDASRLSYNGEGEDDSVEKSSSQARQLVRRVKFQVN
ncbi:OmpA family protein [Nonlabens ponticola]|uniref:OmpA family protein n=1 Tax=Nonlabens ponticola TaxID=2496866 RepID=A0A3S9MZN4_9FLAO|nr:OmpA family protein [Nonlabens ponticola]AZQ44711.1 OmpA family protein [Nonlabens ponticola]